VPISSRVIIAALQKAGWAVKRQKGSHVILTDGQGRITVVPHPKKDLPFGTVRKIERDTGVRLT